MARLIASLDRFLPSFLMAMGVMLLTAGALSSAAVGVTAFAVWRTSRRQPAQRLLHR